MELDGLTEEQVELAEKIWQLDDTEELERFCQSLPRRQRRNAWIIIQLMLWTQWDQHMEVSQDVQEYCRSL